MSKDRQNVKEKKKPANPSAGKSKSEYQSAKGDAIKPITDKKKK